MWTVYVSPRDCRYCVLAKELLDARAIAYEVKVDGGHARWPAVIDQDGTFVGGLDKLRDRLDEPLLSPSMSRFSPVPVKHFDIWQIYKTAQSVNWVPEEIGYGTDLQDWADLSRDEKHFLEHVLAFFNGADGIVQENLMTNFVLEVQYAEARQFYAHQAYIESVHAETYGTLLSTYVTDEGRRDELMRAIQEAPSVRAKAAWALRWMDAAQPFAHRLLAFICVEGVMFSGSFCAIFWMKQRGKLPALTFSNDFISRDEGLHQQFGELLYTRHLKHKVAQADVHRIVGEAVDAEVEFIHEALPATMRDPHIDAPRMVQYVQYVADRILVTLGYSKLYGSQQPFAWMEGISLRGITNFFEQRTSQYVDGMVGSKDKDRPVFGRENDEVDF